MQRKLVFWDSVHFHGKGRGGGFANHLITLPNILEYMQILKTETANVKINMRDIRKTFRHDCILKVQNSQKCSAGRPR